MTPRILVYGSLAIIAFWVLYAKAISKNGFDLDDALIPAKEIRSGGPPRDGIPALIDPELIAVSEAEYLKDDDRVLAVVISGEARAYPIRILDQHEIVNDGIGKQRFAVSYCPLCGTGVVFASDAGETSLIFGVSGLLYNSDVLMYDRNTESLWSQLMGQAISGRLKGVKLPLLPVFHNSWSEWQSRYPDTKVLSLDTGYMRNYSESAYAGYEKSRQLYFKVNNKAPKDYHPKEWVLGVEVDGVFKAYPFKELTENS